MKDGKGLAAPSHKRNSDLAVFRFLAHSLTFGRWGRRTLLAFLGQF
ncbi:hypothetical protein L6X02_RS22860 [Escherichia coli]|nr:hypothetical protein [Escherichia coli]